MAAVYALVRISFVAGRAAAIVHNSIVLHAGRAGLQKIMRAQEARHSL